MIFFSRYENMNDMVRTLEQLKCSLDQHIRTVRLNESSFAGTSAVLEYDTAKTRTNNLISVIKVSFQRSFHRFPFWFVSLFADFSITPLKARSQWDRAKEILKEDGRDDQQKMYESLADMQASQDILAKVSRNLIVAGMC